MSKLYPHSKLQQVVKEHTDDHLPVTILTADLITSVKSLLDVVRKLWKSVNMWEIPTHTYMHHSLALYKYHIVLHYIYSVSYTHLTLPTKRIV